MFLYIEKGHYFQIGLKKLNFFSQEISFWLYLLNWQHFGQMDDILPAKSGFAQKNFFFLALSAKLSTVRIKGQYLSITLKNLIFAQKIFFWLYLLNYQHFGEKDDILRSL